MLGIMRAGLALFLLALTACAAPVEELEPWAERETVLCVRDDPRLTKGITEILLGFRIGPLTAQGRRLELIFAVPFFARLLSDDWRHYDATNGRIEGDNTAYQWPDACVARAETVFCDLSRYQIENQPVSDGQNFSLPRRWPPGQLGIDALFRGESYTCGRYVE